MTYAKKKNTPERIMRSRFFGLNGLGFFCCVWGASPLTPKPMLIAIFLVIASHFFFTNAGRFILGTWLHKEKLRNANLSSHSKIRSLYVGIPLSIAFFVMFYLHIDVTLAQVITELVFPPGQQLTDTMAKIYAFFASNAQLICRALLLYSGISFLVATTVKNLQESFSSRALRKVKNASDAKHIIDTLHWDQFEKVICHYFRTKGYQAEVTNAGADGGIDIILKARDYKELVQCKHWKSTRVGVAVVREIYGVTVAGGYRRGIIITSGLFSSDAWEFAKKDNVRGKIILIDGNSLISIIKDSENLFTESSVVLSPVKYVSPEKSKLACPVCGGEMEIRRGKKNSFYGCKLYPDCRGTRDV